MTNEKSPEQELRDFDEEVVAEDLAAGENRERRILPPVPPEHLPALTVTSRTHAWALSLYLMIFVLGFAHLAGLSSLSSMEAMYGDRFTAIWASWHFPIGLSAMIGAVYAARSANPARGMWVEFGGCAGIVTLKVLYMFALSEAQGFLQGALTTQILFLTLVFGGLGTMAQIWHQQRKISKAKRLRLTTAEVQLAEPKE